MPNPQAALLGLKNTYFAMRHGKSEANERGLIVSNPERGARAFGLCEKGRVQVQDSVGRLRGDAFSALCVMSSDFLRARQTAELVHAGLGLREPIVSSALLRERFFGAFDGGADTFYDTVWAQDALNPSHTDNGVESALNVVARGVGAVQEAERRWAGRQVLLVAHGDVLQLLQSAFEGRSAADHRSLVPLGVAEIRPLQGGA